MFYLSEIKENSNASSWSVGQNENLARLYEAYRRSERSIRQSLPQAIRNLLEKLTQFMNKVYGTLKDTVPLNENIAKAYDSLMGFEDITSETKRVESQGAFREFQGISEETEANILLQNVLFQTVLPDNINEEIDSISEKNIGEPNSTVTFSEKTPKVFLELGFNNLPVEMYKDKIARAFFLDRSEKHGHKDSMNNNILKEVAKHLADPIAVFKSATVEDSLVALYDIDDLKGDMVMASLAPDKKVNFHVINLITSTYGRDNKNDIVRWISDGLLLYYDDKKTRKLTVRLDLPSDASLSRNKVLTKSQLVKENVNGNFSTDSDSILYQEGKEQGPKYKTIEEAEDALTAYRDSNGFKIEENSIRVNAKNVHELYSLAENARGEFTDIINSLQKELGIADDMAFSRKDLKGFDRVIEKAINDSHVLHCSSTQTPL